MVYGSDVFQSKIEYALVNAYNTGTVDKQLYVIVENKIVLSQA